MEDVLVIGAGPAGLAIAAALGQAGLHVGGLAPGRPDAPWAPTYGIWRDELEPLGLAHLLGPVWEQVTAFAQTDEFSLPRAYGLFDNPRLQAHLLDQCERNRVTWQSGLAGQVAHTPTHSQVTLKSGEMLPARLVVDASGHFPALLRRPPAPRIAAQVAYGIVGSFSPPPVRPGQMVLMDYRAEHLDDTQRRQPATFLYAMDLGEGRYFVEETSLASQPPMAMQQLEQRLYQRLAYHGVQLTYTEHIERVQFPMDLPLPYLDQAVLGYGGAASLVHPASGYQVGAALRRAGGVAQAVAAALGAADTSPQRAASAGWQALWPPHLRRKHNLYLFGLQTLLDFDQDTLQRFFSAFFRLPDPLWSGYLSDSLTTRQVLQAMLRLFQNAPTSVRRELVRSAGRHPNQLWKILLG
jgi:lycopene beta-cyclase